MEQLIPHSDARESQPSRKITLGAKGVSLRRALPRQTVTPSIVGTVLFFLTFQQLLPQSVCRGRLARLRVRRIREDNRRTRAATLIQQMVRFRAARHEAAARNRHLGWFLSPLSAKFSSRVSSKAAPFFVLCLV